ncbi:MAG TPA: aspartate dehydrogenase [Burkholderiales bacterium]|nr:aspartate dehydrogenase [Burkholderiales bacterium]
MERIAIIGYGAIGRTLDRLLQKGGVAQVAAVITLPEFAHTARAEQRAPVFTSVGEALSQQPTLFVECGGHGALRAHGEAVLLAGMDLLLASVGALADAALEAGLRAAAARGKAQVLIPSGALGGLDALTSARYAGLEEVRYTSVKAVEAWRGTHAERLVDLDQVKQATIVFTGNARDAARLFPQNANVAAAVALAGCGFEATSVALSADPAAKGNRHRIQASGAFGMIDVTVEGKTLPDNPKTSMLAPMSMVRTIESRRSALRIA